MVIGDGDGDNDNNNDDNNKTALAGVKNLILESFQILSYGIHFPIHNFHFPPLLSVSKGWSFFQT